MSAALHPLSAAVLDSLPAEQQRHMYRDTRGLDASADADDVVQMLALAELEAGASGAPATARRHARRAMYQVRRERGAHHRADWQPHYETTVAAPSPGREYGDTETALDLVRLLGADAAGLIWAWAIERWTFDALGARVGKSKQHAWHAIQASAGRLRAEYPKPRPMAPKPVGEEPGMPKIHRVRSLAQTIAVLQVFMGDDHSEEWDAWARRKLEAREMRRVLRERVPDKVVMAAASTGETMDAYDLASRWRIPAEFAAFRVEMFFWERPEWRARMGPC